MELLCPSFFSQCRAELLGVMLVLRELAARIGVAELLADFLGDADGGLAGSGGVHGGPLSLADGRHSSAPWLEQLVDEPHDHESGDDAFNESHDILSVADSDRVCA